MSRNTFMVLVLLMWPGVGAAQYTAPIEADFVLKNFRFTAGEILPELRMHYRTLGKAERDGQANDVLYQLEASRDYDPGPDLERIRVPLIAVNSADDLINPPELGILEREIKRVAKGRAVVVPFSPDTRGHGTHTIAAVWERHLDELLAMSGR